MASSFLVLSDEFRRILGPAPQLKLLSSEFKFAEGVCWIDHSQFLVVSDFLNDRIMKWSPRGGLSVFVQPSQTANGNTVDAAGRVISCLTRGRSVVRREHDGSLTVLAERYLGRKLTSPNDVVVKRDGTVWFTDPDYGWLVPEFGHCEPPEQHRNRVYRVVPETGEITAVSEDFDKPNGICFSPDEQILYVGDTGMTHGAFRPHRIMAFDVNEDGATLSNPRVFAEITPWVPDGFRCDSQGNLYVTAGDGVQIFTPAGDLIGKILTPEVAGNLSFGMPDRQTLFIGATRSLWSIRLNTMGAG
ncbi:MAG TPA: SMP-30/gluconolactonase/LRE family protein [Lacipirellulaceae bacterium]|nr:SMP-30/gluconolactonase/LRE family protein [Lacipirellulaceae bacterium]HMP05572.1 SMP-30/gluconolactonase/LRE family protein [Lacipirellulaceae bacterium]